MLIYYVFLMVVNVHGRLRLLNLKQNEMLGAAPDVPLDNIFNLAYVGNMYFGSTM